MNGTMDLFDQIIRNNLYNVYYTEVNRNNWEK